LLKVAAAASVCDLEVASFDAASYAFYLATTAAADLTDESKTALFDVGVAQESDSIYAQFDLSCLVTH
jgi:hypothetical protein